MTGTWKGASGRWARFLWLLVGCVLVWPAMAQPTSGSITGSVVDAQRGAVLGATVTASDTDQNIRFTSKSDETGRFVFPQVPAGNYTLRVEAQGFKAFTQSEIAVHANDHLTLGDLVMQVGAITESVEVTGAASTLKTESAEASDTLENKQIENIAVNGRSPLDLVKLVPGVSSQVNLETAGTGGISSFAANGVRNNANNMTLNGVTNIDTGLNGVSNVTVSLDSVQEFKILTGVYQAQYGRSSGAQINMVTKSGTTSFHGSGYWFHRNEGLNANNWANNVQGLPRALFRFNDPGYTIGGPIYIPHHFNTAKTKLFFFWSQEFQRQLNPRAVTNALVPTALERQGDFSQSGGVTDPLTGQPFPNGVIPAERRYAPGFAAMNLLPLPNTPFNVGGQYNYTSQISNPNPRREDVLRVDANLSDRMRIYGTFINNANTSVNPYGGVIAFGQNVPITPGRNATPGYEYAFGHTWIISPTLVNEFTAGASHNSLNSSPANDNLTRTASGVDLPLLFPSAVQDDFIPHYSYGAQNAPFSGQTGSTANAPFTNFATVIDFTDNLSKVAGKHTLKAGVYIQRSRKDQSSFAPANGDYSFGGLQNMALGLFQNFQQANGYYTGQYRYSNVEWYVQDTWKVSPRLTLDLGWRMQWYQPQYNATLQSSSFDPRAYDPAQAAVLYRPAVVNGQNVVINPVTGQTVSPALEGAVVSGVGNPYDGLVLGKQNNYLQVSRFPQQAPRLGVAWDVTGRQSVVLRAGAGIFYDRIQGNPTFQLLTNPPQTLQPQILNGCLDPVNATPGCPTVSPSSTVLFPPNVYAADKNGYIPTVYEYSFGIQSKLPQNLVLDVSYIGSTSHHLSDAHNLNAVPYGAAFLPQYQDPTNHTPGPPGTDALPINFLRPYPGYADIIDFTTTAFADYNSLQIGLTRRTARGLFLGAAYTFSKSLTTTPSSGIIGADFNLDRIDGRNRDAYWSSSSFDQRHNFAVNYVYNFPSIFKSTGAAHAIVDGWQVSGIARFATGSPFTVNWATLAPGASDFYLLITSPIPIFAPYVGQPTITGSYTEPAHISWTGSPYGNRGPFDWLNPAAFHLPTAPSIGLESRPNQLFGPGINNWDISLQKSFNVREKLHFDLRLDAFNAFNHTQFAGVNSLLLYLFAFAPPINATGQYGGFGTVSGARDPRILQTVLRVTF
ncbi:MAG TPA: carboxypeptidase regulatory-like domain-containing protein [Bryobacteraceae bacterium]|nr:carboxypeptidase regulatory-like domain-containing protein [Bryobacteraceae bacterium]